MTYIKGLMVLHDNPDLMFQMFLLMHWRKFFEKQQILGRETVTNALGENLTELLWN